ncbi:hypothetical protein GL272_22190 [Aeromonas veronii]|uniref:hypothetical protein n=1 Tax=Aeromonas veronii TaxID=654 RepID=UPI001C5A7CF5|nr:hypothetical protein [Aeromonas veronii]MBW3779584.1 hypothetical protein [Aeromonas veronii]
MGMINCLPRNAVNKQSGFIELSVISALVVFVSIMVVVMKYSTQAATKTQAEKGADVFKQVVAASMSWYQDKGSFPVTTANLVPTYMSDRAQTMPWGTPITISSTPTTVTVQTDSNGQSNAEQLAGFMAGIIPLAEQSGPGRRVVSATYGKPGTEPALDAMVRRDGTSTLIGEWNVGGQGISNVKDITINGLDNQTVLSGLTYSSVQQNSQFVNLINCPSGRANRKITVIPLSFNKNGHPFNKVGAVEGRWDGVRAFVRVWETDLNGNQAWFVPNPANASVLVNQQCGK